MNRWSGARVGVYVLLALIVIYLFAIGGMVWGMISSGTLLGIIMGTALIIFPLIGVIFIWKDVRFAMRGDALLAKMAAAGDLPEDNLPKQPSGRPVRAVADAEFNRWKTEVESAPEDYRAWARLALAYRASGDTARARQAMRKAIALDAGQDPQPPRDR
ncbi:tetratricopeptide repeat protein [Gulosibacter chungangensis]|uniref:Tetratricopeptide repeat protein n=1 Tax=Gulosibacter chungangensis TaxID=979746 RepID=A0A7J5BBV9_9MICO|nr:hypothetical protein [Gulosibacter chungangensis]KAB1643622.1 hypothetical protein F8O05_07030 [Gulosibacter chungangensis]